MIPHQIKIRGEHEVERLINNDVQKTITHVISIGDPESRWPANFGDREILRLEFSDIGIEGARWGMLNGYTLPDETHVQQMLDFAKGIKENDSLLVHCAQGISRSPAAAIIVLVSCNPGIMDAESVRRVFDSCTNSGTRPNNLIIHMGEQLLGRQPGSLMQTIKETAIKPLPYCW